MEERILKLMGRKDYVPLTTAEILKKLRNPRPTRQKLQRILKDLERDGRTTRIKGNRWIVPREADLIPGRIQITRQGRGFLLPDNPGLGEIAIPASKTGTALHDDHVLVRRDSKPLPGLARHDSTGAVVRILERRRTRFVGTLKRHHQFLSVKPDDPRFGQEIIVPPPRDVGRAARAGDKVVVDLLDWESDQSAPEGVITEVLGPATAEGVDMLGVLRQYDLPLKFPSRVLHEAKRLGTRVSKGDLRDRVDCRQHATITIDPETAKDFDDAFYLERSGDSGWKLWIHIADVSHYVKPGSALDREARERGNSTYLVDRVIPMLPEALSNELCSLKPDVDRLSKCVEFLLSDGGEVLRTKCYSAVIHSKRRFSYEEAMAVIEGRATTDVERMIKNADRLARKIRDRRFKNGSLELDFPETRLRLDNRGRVIEIEKVAYDQSHQLIEEFMLLANEAVANRLTRMKGTSLHRVHESPNPLRLREYRELVQSHNVPCGDLEKPREIQKLLRRLKPLAIGPALRIGLLKSLMRARYAVESLGHYGLAKAKYTHFTSPIRRYADLVVHRTLFSHRTKSDGDLRRIADHISATERNSADAERDSKSVKLYAYLKAQLRRKNPPRYRALVTEVRNFGLFVEVGDLGMSGVVPLSILDDDFYEFDAARHLVRGRRSRREIRTGDRIEVEVARVDSAKKQVDFRLASDPDTEKRKRRPKTKSARKSTPTGNRRSERPRPARKKKAAPRRKPATETPKTKKPRRRRARRRT